MCQLLAMTSVRVLHVLHLVRHDQFCLHASYLTSAYGAASCTPPPFPRFSIPRGSVPVFATGCRGGAKTPHTRHSGSRPSIMPWAPIPIILLSPSELLQELTGTEEPPSDAA